jgi:ubiquinol-cytochrome c reductase cytochrome b subunit
VETGIIRQLPTGEYIEVTRPLTEEEVAALDVKRPPSLPVGAVRGELEVPPPGQRGALGQARERAYKVLTESVPLDGHGNGYGGHGNGHGDGQAEEPAAISSAEHADDSSGDGQEGGGSGDGQEGRGPA